MQNDKIFKKFNQFNFNNIFLKYEIGYLYLYIIIKIILILLLIIFINIINQYATNLFTKINGIKYLNRCLNNLLINKKIFVVNNFCPIISIIIPVYNCEKNIEITISSIKNQNNWNFEIILINDFSQDNSSLIINKLQKYDKRIKIINNKKNMGTLYSRSMGVLQSKGNYIFCIDNDDVFFGEDLFNRIYYKAEKYNYDIIEFKSFEIPNYHPHIKEIKDSYFNDHQNNIIIRQPELGLFPISRDSNYYANDFHIWGKCIKSHIYKKAVNILGQKRVQFYNCWTEDISIVFLIFNIAESFIFLDEYGIFHLDSPTCSTYKLSNKHKFISEIFLLDIIIDFIKNIEINKKLIVQKALLIGETNNITLLNRENKNYLKSILKKIFNLKSISVNDTIEIKKKFNLKNEF